MENKEKLRVLLQHWIDHNNGHAEEFEKWCTVAAEEYPPPVADSIREAITAMEASSKALLKALNAAGGPPAKTEAGDHHHHHH